MADLTATVESPSASRLDMDVNMAKRTASQSSVVNGENSRVKVVCLSGPIKIIVPLGPHEEMDDLAVSDESRDASANIIYNTNKKEPVQSSHLNGGKVTMDPASDTIATDALSPALEKIPFAVKKIDCNHPDEAVSPL
jgi:hypothetical protein